MKVENLSNPRFYINIACTGSIWAVTLHRLDKFSLHMVTDQDSFSGIWFMLSNGKIRQEHKSRPHRGHHWKWLEWQLFPLFLNNLTVVLGFLTLQDRHNICTFTLAAKQDRKACQQLAFLPVSKASNKIHILSIY